MITITKMGGSLTKVNIGDFPIGIQPELMSAYQLDNS